MSADFWAGYLSGAAGILIGNPLDLVKTRLQAGKVLTSPDAAAQSTAAVPRSFKQHFEHTGTLVKGEISFIPLCFVECVGCVRFSIVLIHQSQHRHNSTSSWLWCS